MIVIVASNYDGQSRMLSQRLGQEHVWLLTPRDLSRPGWSFHPSQPKRSVAVINGKPVRSDAITAVWTRLPYIDACELPTFRTCDRAYAAMEMSMFLLAWLDSLRCRVINRATPNCLSGPAWRPVDWMAAAGRCDVRYASNEDAESFSTKTGNVNPLEVIDAVVFNHEPIGDMPSSILARTRRLARDAGVQLMRARYRREVGDTDDNWTLIWASACPHLSLAYAETVVKRVLTESP